MLARWFDEPDEACCGFVAVIEQFPELVGIGSVAPSGKKCSLFAFWAQSESNVSGKYFCLLNVTWFWRLCFHVLANPFEEFVYCFGNACGVGDFGFDFVSGNWCVVLAAKFRLDEKLFGFVSKDEIDLCANENAVAFGFGDVSFFAESVDQIEDEDWVHFVLLIKPKDCQKS